MKKLYTSVPANIRLTSAQDDSYSQSKNQYTMKTLLLPQATSTPTPEKATTTQQNKNNGFNSAARLLMSLAILLGIQGMAFGQTTQYSASGTFVAPAGVTSVVVKAWGGGGKGAGLGNGNPGGGGSGAYAAHSSSSVSAGTTYDVIVGVGGITTSNPSGTASTFNGISAGGGSGTNSSTGGSGGTASGGTTNTTGGSGVTVSGNDGGAGGSAPNGGVGGAGGNGPTVPGSNGSPPGGGGGGAGKNSTAFGTGARGQVETHIPAKLIHLQAHQLPM